MVAKVDVGKPFLAVGLARRRLEREHMAGGVVARAILARRGVPHQPAHVIEVAGIERRFLLL